MKRAASAAAILENTTSCSTAPQEALAWFPAEQERALAVLVEGDADGWARSAKDGQGRRRLSSVGGPTY
jgi:hypothetical protein